MSLTVREATVEDAEAVRDCHLASIRGLGGEAYDAEQVAAWAHPRDPADYPVESADTRFLVAERDGDVVGFGWLTADPRDHFADPVDAEVTAVYVAPAAARQGVGSRLYADLEASARRRNLDSLGLWASLPAVPFYEAQGFESVQRRDHQYDGVTLPVVEMRKDLAADASAGTGLV